jgi:hypothetical protein
MEERRRARGRDAAPKRPPRSETSRRKYSVWAMLKEEEVEVTCPKKEPEEMDAKMVKKSTKECLEMAERTSESRVSGGLEAEEERSREAVMLSSAPASTADASISRWYDRWAFLVNGRRHMRMAKTTPASTSRHWEK